MCENCGIDSLVILHITNEQIETLTQNLIDQRFFFTRISSSGGDINYHNNSMLISISIGPNSDSAETTISANDSSEVTSTLSPSA